MRSKSSRDHVLNVLRTYHGAGDGLHSGGVIVWAINALNYTAFSVFWTAAVCVC